MNIRIAIGSIAHVLLYALVSCEATASSGGCDQDKRMGATNLNRCANNAHLTSILPRGRPTRTRLAFHRFNRFGESRMETNLKSGTSPTGDPLSLPPRPTDADAASLEIIARFSGLDTHAGTEHLIAQRLLMDDVMPFISGSRQMNVRVYAKDAARARESILYLVRQHGLKAMVLDSEGLPIAGGVLEVREKKLRETRAQW